MSHYAYVRDGVVTDVICAEQDFIDLITQQKLDRNPQDTGHWIQTSYNTRGGIHLQNGTPLRKNFAGVGDLYNEQADAFYRPRPYDTWILNTETYLWEAPVELPVDEKKYTWNPATNNWREWILGETI